MRIRPDVLPEQAQERLASVLARHHDGPGYVAWVDRVEIAESAEFFSFGTNDLTQLTLGIDRNNAKIQKHFDEMHPAVLGEIAKVISVCKCYNVKTSICGQAGSRPEMAEFLVKHGIDSISANADAVAKIRHAVARAEKKVLLDAEREKINEEE